MLRTRRSLLRRSALAATLLTGGALLLAAPPAPAVIAGDATTESRYPWMSDLGCGGTLIAPDRVVTAAHCVTSLVDQPRSFWFKVAVGERRAAPHSTRYTYFQPASFALPATRGLLAPAGPAPAAQASGAARPGVAIDAVAIHPRYRALGNAAAYDIAILRLAAPVATPVLPLAKPGDGSDRVRRAVTVLGRGQINHPGLGPQGATAQRRGLRRGGLALVADATCRRLYAPTPDDFDASSMICAGDPRATPRAEKGARYTAACYGDSGGPLVGKDARGHAVLVGIVSWGGGKRGDSCGQLDHYPGVYARVAKLRGFALAADPAWVPVGTGAPHVAGTPTVGSRVTCEDATFDRPATVTDVSWMLSGRIVRNRAGATDLVLPGNAAGLQVSCAVRAKGPTGTATSVGSAPLAVAAP